MNPPISPRQKKKKKNEKEPLILHELIENYTNFSPLTITFFLSSFFLSTIILFFSSLLSPYLPLLLRIVI